MVPDALSGGPHFAAYCERYIRHTKGRWAGRPLIYEDWQREFWWEALEFDPATGLRIYNEVGLGIPRKNTKSTMASADGLYMLDADGEPEPEVYVAAAARNQAGIVLGQARSMVNRSPLLLDRLVPHRYVIECPRNGGIMRSLSSDAALQHGLNPSANIVDELHAHKNAELYTALTTGTGAREQPFTLERTKRALPGPAFAFDRQGFGESAEMLGHDGLNMVEVPMTAAVMGPPSTLAYELITTGRLVHLADPILAEHVANTTAVLTDRGMKVTRSKHGSTRPNVAAVAMVRAIAMAMLDPPPAPKPRVYGSFR